jgi:hypothetical protein
MEMRIGRCQFLGRSALLLFWITSTTTALSDHVLYMHSTHCSSYHLCFLLLIGVTPKTFVHVAYMLIPCLLPAVRVFPELIKCIPVLLRSPLDINTQLTVASQYDCFSSFLKRVLVLTCQLGATTTWHALLPVCRKDGEHRMFR